MHATVAAFIGRETARHGPFSTVVEIGGRDVNGTVRPFFDGAEYTAIDLRDGPGVDIVSDALDWMPVAPVECVVCTEVLEHAPRASELCGAARSWLADGGLFLVTAAADPREPHSAIDEDAIRPDEFYRNVTEHDLRTWLAGFATVMIEAEAGDIRAAAFK